MTLPIACHVVAKMFASLSPVGSNLGRSWSQNGAKVGQVGAKLGPSCDKFWLKRGAERRLGVSGCSWGHISPKLRALEAIWEVLAENLAKPRVFQDSGGGPEFGTNLWRWLAGGFCPRGVARGLLLTTSWRLLPDL